jgi:hypothetical protein
MDRVARASSSAAFGSTASGAALVCSDFPPKASLRWQVDLISKANRRDAGWSDRDDRAPQAICVVPAKSVL